MSKKYGTVCGIIGLILGIVGGIAGTAFSMGAERQNIKNNLAIHTAAIEDMKLKNDVYGTFIQKELNRYNTTIAAQIIQLQSSISQLSEVVSNLRTDVQVLKALMERIENNFKRSS